MAPPKRKTGGGRVTPKGTRPEDRHAAAPTAERHGSDTGTHEVAASSRYTPKAARREMIPPSWIPIIMVVLLVVGGLLIMARYLVFTDTNIPTLIGLACILGGLYTATKWR